jgi:hypothetical protein
MRCNGEPQTAKRIAYRCGYGYRWHIRSVITEMGWAGARSPSVRLFRFTTVVVISPNHVLIQQLWRTNILTKSQITPLRVYHGP